MSQQQTTDAAQKILIIDDDPINLRVLRDHLQQRGFEVTTAQDGEEGVQRARIVKPELILLDIMMPGINGLETCRRLKASDDTREIPVIFKTALTDTATKIAGFEAGGVDYVTSPIQIEEVMARVQTHVTLHTVKKRLEQARDELEDRVQQRTAELNRLNRELRAISECNQTLLRAMDEQTLVDEICRIICEEAGYRMAWVGYAQDDDAKSVRPMAWSGIEDGYLERADIHWSEDSERGRGPSGKAIRSGKTCYVQDLTTDGSFAPWREGALKRGYRSIIALPLKDEDAKTFGNLTIYSSEPNAFSAEEIRMLEELAADLAFGITVIRARIERDLAQEEKGKLQQHLQQSQKMEAIGQLAGGVAHDFNNILGIINGYSEIVLRRRKLDEEQRSQIEEILAAGQRAAALTRQLLAFSRKLLLMPRVLNLNSVIEGFDKMLRRLIGDEIEVRTILDPTLSAVNVDPNQMEQVLLNLCINARDAMPDGGRITIQTANLEINGEMAAQHLALTPGQYVTLSVSDTGMGMNQETQSHMFEPFFTTKGPERGTGLGLATVHGIVKQSGGHVSVYSEPGRGTTFRIYLPAVSQRTKEGEQSPRPHESLQGSETILLVEDAAPLRSLYRTILEERGYTVLEAGDGECAIQVAERYEGNLALLLSDVSLPKMKGPALATILVQQRPTMKVLFMSGHSDEVVSGRDHLLAAGAGFIQKPFGAEDLFRKMREILNSREPERLREYSTDSLRGPPYR